MPVFAWLRPFPPMFELRVEFAHFHIFLQSIPGKGTLSSRMLIPGNTWQQVWQTAKAVPARRQKRLFDDTKEAEKILHFFEAQTIGQIVRLTLATLMHTAVVAIGQQNEVEPVCSRLFEGLHCYLVSQLCKLSRESWIDSAAGAVATVRSKLCDGCCFECRV